MLWATLAYALWPTWFVPDVVGADEAVGVLKAIIKWGPPWLVFMAPSFPCAVGMLILTPVTRPFTTRDGFFLFTLLAATIGVSRLVLLIGAPQRAAVHASNQRQREHLKSLETSEDEFIAEGRKLSEKDRRRLFDGRFRSVTVANTDFNDEDLQKLNLGRLTFLHLQRTQVTDQGLACLADAKRLEQVELSDTKITDEGLRAFVNLPNLKMITLANAAVTDKGIDILDESESLEHIGVCGSSVTKARISRFGEERRAKIRRELGLAPVVPTEK